MAKPHEKAEDEGDLPDYKLTEKEKCIEKFADLVFYSARYSDDAYEYRHVILPKPLAAWLPKGGQVIATEDEWRSLGIRQSPGWEHFEIHKPEPHIMLFRRPKELGLQYPSSQTASS